MEGSDFKKVKVAVFGHGYLGKWHCEKAMTLPEAELVAIVEPSPASREEAKKKYPQVKVVQSPEEILSEIEAAIVVTPTSFHQSLVELLLKNHKHVFCEKPLCSNSQEAALLEKYIQQKNLILQVGHSERYHEIWENLSPYQDILEGPGIVKINRLAPFKGRALDVDVVQDLMIHDLDLLVFLLQEMPSQITAQGYKMVSSTWDYVCAEFIFPSGHKAYLTACRNYVKEVREVEVASRNGCLIIDLNLREVHASRSLGAGASGGTIKSTYEKRDHLLLEQKEFYHSIRSGKQPRVGFQEGAVAVTLVEKVLLSLQTGEPIFLKK